VVVNRTTRGIRRAIEQGKQNQRSKEYCEHQYATSLRRSHGGPLLLQKILGEKEAAECALDHSPVWLSPGKAMKAVIVVECCEAET
jgi:hypothetical protein